MTFADSFDRKCVSKSKSTRDEDGACDEDDYVFSLSEQENRRLLKDPRTKALRVSAGHVEIVGEQEVDPRKLIDVLQREQILEVTPPSRRAALSRLIAQLFGAT